MLANFSKSANIFLKQVAAHNNNSKLFYMNSRYFASIRYYFSFKMSYHLTIESTPRVTNGLNTIKTQRYSSQFIILL